MTSYPVFPTFIGLTRRALSAGKCTIGFGEEYHSSIPFELFILPALLCPKGT